MRKFLISAALAASALTAAAPAAAQWAPPAYGGQYGAPYGNAYGYHNNHGQVRSLEARLEQLQREIRRLDQRDILSEREANRLRSQAWDVRNDLRRAARDGINGHELQRFHRRVAELDYRIQREARDGNRWNSRYGSRDWDDRDGWRDRDHDGRNDRHEDDRGRDHD